ncbi:MAG: hypothetical protein ABIK19_06250 [candidate division WOR-3 bacterium]
MYKYLVVFGVLFNWAIAGHLLTNGDFEQPLNIGWYSSFGLPGAYDTIDRQTYFDPDPDYEARVKKYDEMYAKLYQTVNVPTTDLDFSINAKLYAYEYTPGSGYWAAAAVCLRYLGANNNLLGETRIFHKTASCPWTNSSTIHLIHVTDPNNWYNYSFNLNNELANLPGVNAHNIKKIQVVLIDTTNGC